MSEYSAVSFKIEADNKPALSAIEEVRNALNDLKVNFKFKIPKSTIKSAMKAMTEEVTSEAKKMAEEMEAATDNMFGSAGSIGESATSALKVPETYTMGLDMANNRLTTMETSLEKVADEWGNVTRASEYYWKVAEPDRGQANASRLADMMEGIGGGGEGMNPEGLIAGLSQEMTDFGQLASDAWDQFKEGAKSAMSYAISAVKSFASTLTGVLKSGFDKLTESIRNSTRGFDKLFNSIKRIAMYRALRTAIKTVVSSIKEGIENLYRWSRLNDGVFSGSMDKLATEALHVKNALGAMLAPVINALTPVVEKLAHAFINVVNSINQFVAALTGASTWTKALHTPITYAQAAGSSFDKAEKNAKKLKNTILGFDEINRLNGKDDDSDALPYGDMFEKQNLGNFWKDWLDKLDWTDLGRLFAQKVNKALKKLDNWILNVARPWAMKWSTRIATFLNGFVEDFDWKLLGKTVADGMMVVVDSANNFFNLFYAQKFGKGLAKTVKGWFENMNWEAVGQFFANGINFVADTAAGFFREFVKDAETYGYDLGVAFNSWVHAIKWETIREAIGTGLKSIGKMIEGFVKGEDGSWDKFRDEFVKTINTVLGSPDVTTMVTAAAGLINDLVSALGSLDWYSVGYNIGQFLGSIDWINAMKTAASAMWEGFKGALKGILDSGGAGNLAMAALIVAGIGGAVSTVLPALGSVFSSLGGQLVQYLGMGLLEAIPAVFTAVATGPGGIVAAVAGIAYDIWGICSLASMGYELVAQNSELAAARANESAAAVNLQTALAAQGIEASLEEVNAYLNGTMSLAELTGGKFGSMAKTVSDEITGMANDTGKAFDTLSDNTFDFTDDVNKAVVTFLTEASDGSAESMKQLSDDTVKIFSDVSDAISKINQALSNSFSKMASSISEAMQRMYNNVSSNMTKIAKNVEDNARRIQNAFSSISGSNLTVKGYASGGFPEDGLFMANHNELVGGFANGKTAVANNMEIISGISEGVYQAVTSAMGNQNGGDIVIRIDSEEIARASIKGQRRIDRRMNPTVKFTG